MSQKHTQQKGLFFALRRPAEVILSVVLSMIIGAGPVEASTWKPTALVNTEAFQAIDDSDSTANVVLKFGDTLAKTLTYNRTATRFEFNDQVSVNGNLNVTATMSGRSLVVSGTGAHYTPGFATGAVQPLLTTDLTFGTILMGTGSLRHTGTGTMMPQLDIAGRVPTNWTGSGSTGGNTGPSGLFLQGKYAYTADYGDHTLSVLDITHPSSPKLLGSTDVINGGGNPTPMDLFVQGQYAYTANGSTKDISIIDVSNPYAPTFVSNLVLAGGSTNIGSIAVQGRYAYATDGSTAKLFVVDVSDPKNPFVVRSIPTGTGPHDVVVQGQYVYTANYQANSIGIFDISNPSNPVFAGSVSTGASTGPDSLAVQGRYAYTANNSDGTIGVFDISNPASATAIGSVSTGYTSGPYHIVVQGRMAYMANIDYGTFVLMDISNPRKPVLAGNVPINPIATPEAVAVSGRYAYMVNYEDDSLVSFDLGGTYTQELEAGSAEFGALTLQGNLQGMAASFQGAVTMGRGFLSNGPSAVTNTATGAFALTVTSKTGALLLSAQGGKAQPHIAFGTGGTYDTKLYRNAPGRLQTDGSLYVNGTSSGAYVKAQRGLASSGSLVFEGAASGSSLYLGTSLAGAGLSSCSNSTTSKLLYDNTTGRFSCGTDQTGAGGTFGSGNVLALGAQKFVSKQGDTMTGALQVNIKNGVQGTLGINAVQTVSGAVLHAEKTLSTSGSLVWEGAASGSSLTVGAVGLAKNGTPLTVTTASTNNLAIFGNIGASNGYILGIKSNALQVTDQTDGSPGALLFNPGGGNVGVNVSATPRAALEVAGSISGASLMGAGLGSCSNSTTSKLLYNSTTGKFSCGTDQAAGAGFGSGNVLTIGNQKYVSKQGDTMTGALQVNIKNGVQGTLGINAVQTVSGAVLHAEKTLSTSGSLVWEGAASGSSIFISGAASFGGPLTFGNQITDVMTINAAAWTFVNDTNFALSGGVNGLSFDTDTFSVDALNDRIGIHTTAPKTRLEVVGTISGSLIRASNMVLSGAVVYSSGNTLKQTAKGLSGQLLLSQGTAAPRWGAPVGGMIWYFDGTQAVATSKGPQITMPMALTLSGITLKAKGAPTGADLIYNIRKNGVSIFSTRPQINAGATSGGSNAILSTTDLPTDSTLTIDIDQVGSGFAGSGVTIMLKGIRKY